MVKLELIENKPKELVYTMKCDLERAERLVKIPGDFWAWFLLTRKKDETNGEDQRKEDKPNYKAAVQKFFNTVQRTKGVQTIVEKSKRYGFGRLYTDSAHNAVTLPRRIANFLFGAHYNDIDIVNCHPELFEQIIAELHRTNVLAATCPNLTKYVTERKECLEKHGISKTDVIAAMYSEKPPECEFLREINSFLMSNLYNALAAKFPKIIERMVKARIEKNAKANRPEKQNLKGAVLSFIAQTYEREIACSMDRYFENNGLFDRCMVYDGFYIDKKFSDTDSLSAHILEETGFSFKLLFKDTHDVEFLEKVEEFEDANGADVIKVYDDYSVAASIINEHKDDIFKYENELWAYFENTWTKDVERIFEFWIQECGINIGSDVKLMVVRAQTHKFKNYVKQMKNQCLLNYQNDNEQGAKLNSVKDIIPFEDGFYDFKKGKFIGYGETRERMYFTYKIAQKMVTEEFSEEARRDLYQIILDIFDTEDLMKEVLQFFCRALSGHYEDKLYCVFVGERNSGKGVLNDILASAFGRAVGSFSFDEFTVRKTMESVERRRGFMSTFTHCSLAVSQEISSSAIVDSTLIKTACSGGDTIVCRKAFEKLEDGGRIRALMCIFGQGIPEFTDNDAMDTMLLCNMPCKFEDKPSEENFGFVSKRADPEVKNKLKSSTVYHRMFVLLVFSHFSETKPDYTLLRKATMDNKEQIMEEPNPYLTMRDLILKYYAYSPDPKDRIATSAINDLIKNDDSKKQLNVMTSQKITNYLKTLGVSKVKSNGKTFFTNLRKKTENED